MTTMVWVYLGYLAICMTVTMLVAKTLKVHGPVFMAGTSSADSPLLKARTHLTVVGFYLVTLGLVGFAIRFGGHATDAKTAIEVLCTKIGAMVFVIGFLHFAIVSIFASSRNNDANDAKYASKKVAHPN